MADKTQQPVRYPTTPVVAPSTGDPTPERDFKGFVSPDRGIYAGWGTELAIDKGAQGNRRGSMGVPAQSEPPGGSPFKRLR